MLLPLGIPGAYDYSLPDGISVSAGQFVQVPLGPRIRIGVIWDGTEAKDAPDPSKLKPVQQVLDLPPLPEASRQFIDWVARYTMTPTGSVLRMAIATPSLFKQIRPLIRYRWNGQQPERMTAARARVLEVLESGLARSATDIAEAAAVSTGVITGLADQNVLERLELDLGDTGMVQPDPNHEGPVLSQGQAAAADALCQTIKKGAYSTILLEGVTGSGKTEVYFEAIAEALRTDETAQILVLVPEIALTNQLLERFETRFGARPLAWHSNLTGPGRRAAWLAAARGDARVVVGARSALFLPFTNLRLVIVDEEHDQAYKQEDQVVYQGRDMAVVRASLADCPAVLVSATPSLETMTNCQNGKYGHVTLPERHGGATLPEVKTVDMRAQVLDRGHYLSPDLVAAVRETAEAGEQSLLFLNRRGYAPAAICKACGHRLQRDNCSAPLVVHRFGGRLRCHYCDFSMPMPRACPNCGVEDKIVPYGPGVERLAEEVSGLFPDLRVAVMASDTVKSPQEVQNFIRRIEKHELDIVVGTQLVTKGHHFPMLTLVGIVDADLGLSGGDLRAGERTYQQLWQVAGRAGRAARPGRVLIQTYMPDHPVMEALVGGDGPAFYAAESENRREGGWPPFGRLAALILSGNNEADVSAQARRLAQAAPRIGGLTILGPAPAPFARLRGRFRYRLLIKAQRGPNLQGILKDWLSSVPDKSTVRVTIDIDPYSFL